MEKRDDARFKRSPNAASRAGFDQAFERPPLSVRIRTATLTEDKPKNSCRPWAGVTLAPDGALL